MQLNITTRCMNGVTAASVNGKQFIVDILPAYNRPALECGRFLVFAM